MSALRIKVGDTWWTGEPGDAQSAMTSAQGVAWAQVAAMQMLDGPEWAAKVALDLKQKGVQLSWLVTRQFETVTAMATWLAEVLSSTPAHDWQEDVICRWDHEDGEGYTESMIPWGALRVNSITHEGPTTLRLSLMVMGPELQDHTLRTRRRIVTEAGEPITTEAGETLLTEDYVTLEA